MDFAEFLVLGLILATVVATGAAFGAIAYFRLDRYRKALLEQEARIAQLEAQLGLRPAPPEGAPAPLPPPIIRPAPIPAPQPAPRPAAKVALVPAAAPPPEPAPAPAPVAARVTPFIKPEALRPPPEPAAPAAEAPAAALPPLVVNMSVVIGVVGAGIAIAIIYALIAAYQGGYFNELSQLLLGYVMGAGMIAGAEILKRRHAEKPPEDWQAQHGPAILAAAGIVCAFGTTFAGYARLGLLQPAATLGLMGLCALGGLALSLRHGRPLAWEGLAAGFAAPFLSGVIGASSTALFAYLFAVAAAGLALAKHRNWLALGSASAGLAIAWAVAWTFQYFLPSAANAGAAYLLALAVLGIAFAWDDATSPVDFSPGAAKRVPWPPRAWVGMALIAAAGAALTTMSIRAGGAGLPAVHALVLALAGVAVAAALREAFAAAAVVLAGFCLAALAAWPSILFAADARAFAGAAGAAGFVASIGGWLMMARNAAPAPGAIIAALAPAATLLIAYLRLGGAIDQPFAWGGMALFLAAFNGFALDRISKAAGGAAQAPGAATAFAAASAACAMMAGAFAFDNVRMAAGLAVLLVPLAWLDRRLDIAALRFAGAAIGAVTVALLSPIALMRAEIEPAPLLNTLAPTFLIAILSVWAGARLFALGPAGYLSRVTIFLRICLVALVIAFGFAEIRHLANAGDMTAAYTSLWEAGGHSVFLLAIACAIAWRYGRADRPLLQWTETLTFAAGTAHALFAGLAWLSPWWGVAPAAAPGPVLLNPLLFAYAAPAALLALYAVLRARIGPSVRTYVAGAAALLCGLAWLLLEVRHGFHPTAMASAALTGWEHAAYSVTLIAVSGGLLAAALAVTGPARLMLRVAAAVLTAAGFLKALALDAGFVDTPLRYAVYALVSAAAVGALLGYHRYVLPGPTAPGQINPGEPDGDLIPPRP